MTEELNRAAKEYAEKYLFSIEHTKSPEDHFKAGAEWCVKYIVERINFMGNNNPKL